MDFFEKIKRQLKVAHGKWMLFFAAFAGLLCFCAISVGFSSDADWQVGLRGFGNGTSVPNWLLAGLFLIGAVIFCAQIVAHCKALVKNSEYNEMLCAVASIGDAEEIGSILCAIGKNPHVKSGTLRFNEKILFHMSGLDVKVIAPTSIQRIGTEVVKRGAFETNFVCVHYGNDVLRIKVSKRHVLQLLEELRGTYC